MSERTLATRALQWSWIQAASSAAVQLGTTAALARLLAPEDFGAVALAMVLLRFLTYFSQLGFSVAIVQRVEVEANVVSELASISVLAGCAFTAIGLLLSTLVAGTTAEVLRALSATFVLNGLAAVPYGLLRRQLRNRALAVSELGGQLLGNLGVAVFMAWSGAGVWSIVAGMLCQQAVTTALVWFSVRQDRVRFSRPSRRTLSYLSYGIRHSINTFLEFVFYNIEVVVISRWYGIASTGTYNRAYAVSHLAVEQVVASVVRVLFPLLSRVRGDRTKERQTFGLAFFYCGMFVSGFCGAMFVAAPQIASVLLGGKWSSTVPLIQVFALAIPFRYLLNIQSAWLDAVGALRGRAVVVGICIVVKGALVAFTLFGNVSVVWMLFGVVLVDVLWQVLYLSVVPSFTGAPKSLLLRAYAWFIVNFAVVAAVVYVATIGVERFGLGQLPLLAVQIVLGAAMLVLAIIASVRARALDLDTTVFSDAPVIGRLLPASHR